MVEQCAIDLSGYQPLNILTVQPISTEAGLLCTLIKSLLSPSTAVKSIRHTIFCSILLASFKVLA
jgi:hypothetical protein